MYQTRISHVHLKVRDLERAVSFYTTFFDLRVVELVGHHYAFLSGSSVHHELALQLVEPRSPQPHPCATGLHHLAFEVPDTTALAQAYGTLTAAGVAVALVNHLISWSLYFNDPDGNSLEIFWATRRQPGGDSLWGGRNLPLPTQDLSPQ